MHDDITVLEENVFLWAGALYNERKFTSLVSLSPPRTKRVNPISHVTGFELQQKEPQTAYPVSITWMSFTADTSLMGQ